ncbi:MAG: hypothetical protein ACTS6J_12165 [Burkholderiales bacterium]
MTSIEPLHIAPRGTPIFDAARLAVAVAVLVSAPWAWLIQQERDTYDRLLADATARHARVSDLVITYSNGARAYMEIGEQK